jgi:hypothetical protein
MSDQDHGLSQERRHARKGRGYGGPCFDARDAAYDRRRDEVSLDEVERIVIWDPEFTSLSLEARKP